MYPMRKIFCYYLLIFKLRTPLVKIKTVVLKNRNLLRLPQKCIHKIRGSTLHKGGVTFLHKHEQGLKHREETQVLWVFRLFQCFSFPISNFLIKVDDK